MKYCSKLVAFAVLAIGVAFAAMIKFEPMKMIGHLRSDVQDIMNLVMKPHTLSRYIPAEVYEEMGLDPKTRLMSYNWSNCGNKTDENMIIQDIKFKPDPLVFPGTFAVSFNLHTKVNLTYYIRVVVQLSKKVSSSWLKLPCFGMIGSCTYGDVCTYLDQIGKCPPEFLKAKLPCKCPFPNGTYVLPSATFKVKSGVLSAGDYHIRANLTHNDGSVNVGCYDFYVSLG